MSKELLFVLLFFWVISAAFVIYEHNKNYRLTLEIIIGAIILGPILALLVRDSKEERRKIQRQENVTDDNHRRWFQLNDMVNRELMQSNWSRTIPSPPPISQRKQNKKEFKMLRGYVENR
jgi:hypothetical protein